VAQHAAAQLFLDRGVFKSAGRRSGVSSLGLMLTMLEYLASLGIILVSLGGFAAALLLTCAIWFDRN